MATTPQEPLSHHGWDTAMDTAAAAIAQRYGITVDEVDRAVRVYLGDKADAEDPYRD